METRPRPGWTTRAHVRGGIRALHVVVLFDFAIAQPLFDMIDRSPEFLVAHRLGPFETIGFAFALAFGFPALLALAKWGIEALVPPLAAGLHGVSVAVLCAWIALPIAGQALPVGSTAVALALAIGVGAAIAYAVFRPLRSAVTVASPVIAAFPLLFLLTSQPLRMVGGSESATDGPPVSGIDGSVPVVMVIFDALPLSSLLDRDDHIDPRRYPNFAALADRSHWFRNATTVATVTNYAVPALLTGRYPQPGAAPNRRDHPVNLFTALAGSHSLNVVEPVTHLCPEESCASDPTLGVAARARSLAQDLRILTLHAALPRDWARELPDVTETWAHFGNPGDGRDEVVARRNDARWVFSRFLEGIVDGSPAGLHFVHLNVPHTPYLYLPSGRTYRPTKSHPNQRLEPGRVVDANWAETQALQRHLLQVGYCDTLLGELTAHLEALDLFDRALVVVTSDHGVSIRPGVESRRLTGDPASENPGDLLPIPLLVKLPGQQTATVDDRNVEIIDVFPTLVDALGGQIATPIDGQSLLRTDGPERARKRVIHAQAFRTFPRAIPGLRATADRIEALFDFEGRGLDAVYDVGPHRELLGRRVAELPEAPPGADGDWRVRLEAPEAFERVDIASGFVPAQVVGEIEGPGLPGGAADIAVSVDGVIRAVTRSYQGWERSRFSAMLPETAFRDGNHRIEIFVVADGEPPALVGTRGDARVHYTPVRAADGRLAMLISSDDEVLPVVPSAVAGAVTASRGDFVGRAVHRRTRRIGDRVLLFSGGRFAQVHSLGSDSGGPPGTNGREDFRFADPGLSDDSTKRGALRFVGIARGVASVLPYEGDDFAEKPWAGRAADLRIESWGGREGLDVSSGHWIPVVGGEPLGEVRIAERLDDRVVFAGRVTGSAGPPDGLFLFANRKLIGVVPVSVRNSDATVGRFRIGLPNTVFGGGGRRARFFAIVESPGGSVAREVRAAQE